MIFHPIDYLLFLALGVSIWAKFKTKGYFNKWSQVETRTGLSGANAARQILNSNGLQHISIEAIQGTLSDHYDPIQKVIRLSESVYYGRSIASVSVAAHEVGHATQHQRSYLTLITRHRIFPFMNLVSSIAPFLLVGGMLLGQHLVIGIGIIFFFVAVVFQLVTLPVEFDASKRARNLMLTEGILYKNEEEGVKKVLNAAALTYVGATIISVFEIIKFVRILFQGKQKEGH